MTGAILKSPMWVQGDRSISQSPGEPIFVSFPKAGGALSTIIDVSKEKLGGGRSITTRILSGIGGKGTATHAGPALFDGTSFFWIEDTKAGTTYSWAIKRVPLAGGPSVSLYDSKGELSSLTKVGDRLVFFRDEPESPSKKPVGPKKGGISISGSTRATSPRSCPFPSAVARPKYARRTSTGKRSWPMDPRSMSRATKTARS